LEIFKRLTRNRLPAQYYQPLKESDKTLKVCLHYFFLPEHCLQKSRSDEAFYYFFILFGWIKTVSAKQTDTLTMSSENLNLVLRFSAVKLLPYREGRTFAINYYDPGFEAMEKYHTR